jgi:16S rRNA (guanine966-N2)-methyltransferase
MRIIAGAAKGRKLKAPGTAGTRPATDRVREAVFSSLGSVVEGARVADLYAGSGSFGLEALSRGADSAVFVERGRQAATALRANVGAVGLGGEVVVSDVRRWLETAAAGGLDLAFIDPPWDMPTPHLDGDLALLDRLLSPGATVVLSRRRSDADPSPPETWRSAAEKRYGDTKIFRYEKVRE